MTKSASNLPFVVRICNASPAWLDIQHRATQVEAGVRETRDAQGAASGGGTCCTLM